MNPAAHGTDDNASGPVLYMALEPRKGGGRLS